MDNLDNLEELAKRAAEVLRDDQNLAASVRLERFRRAATPSAVLSLVVQVRELKGALEYVKRELVYLRRGAINTGRSSAVYAIDDITTRINAVLHQGDAR